MDLSRLEGDDAVMGYWRFEEDEETHTDITQVNDLTKVNAALVLHIMFTNSANTLMMQWDE